MSFPGDLLPRGGQVGRPQLAGQNLRQAEAEVREGGGGGGAGRGPAGGEKRYYLSHVLSIPRRFAATRAGLCPASLAW